MLCLASTKSWAQFTALHTLGEVLHACNPSIHEAEAGKSEIQDHLWLHREFKAGLGYSETLSQNKETKWSCAWCRDPVKNRPPHLCPVKLKEVSSEQQGASSES